MNEANGSASALLRIGELSRRVGVSEHVLRAWESRYGLLKPQRSEGGYRLYSGDDQNRVRRMQVHLASGLAAAQAAQAVLTLERVAAIQASEQAGADDAADAELTLWGDLTRDVSSSAAALRRALDEMNEPTAQRILDRLLRENAVEIVLRDVLIPYLHDVGERWAQGELSVAQEHFATHVVRGRMASLARGWGSGDGPYVLLACPPGELHDLALLAFGLILDRNGWRVGYLGADTPIQAVIQVSSEMRPSLVVLAASTPERFAAITSELTVLALVSRVAIAGAGATQQLADTVHAELVASDPVTAAEELKALLT